MLCVWLFFTSLVAELRCPEPVILSHHSVPDLIFPFYSEKKGDQAGEENETFQPMES